MSYASTTDLERLGINADALAGISTATKQAALDATSDQIDDAIETGGRYQTPLTTYPDSVKLNNCKLAQFELMSVEGYYPDDEDQKTIRQRYEDALKWIEGLENGKALSGVVDADPDDDDDSQVVTDSDTARGWSPTDEEEAEDDFYEW